MLIRNKKNKSLVTTIYIELREKLGKGDTSSGRFEGDFMFGYIGETRMSRNEI